MGLHGRLCRQPSRLESNGREAERFDLGSKWIVLNITVPRLTPGRHARDANQRTSYSKYRDEE